jgi:hypothetical protein
MVAGAFLYKVWVPGNGKETESFQNFERANNRIYELLSDGAGLVSITREPRPFTVRKGARPKERKKHYAGGGRPATKSKGTQPQGENE